MIKDWINANTEEELLKNGTFTEVRKMIKNDLGQASESFFGKKSTIFTVINITSNSTKGLVKKLKLIREFMNMANENGEVFKSNGHKYIYFLTELDGEERLNKLKVYKSHYLNKSLAKSWYLEISKEIHPDKLIGKNIKNADRAMAELAAMYKEMIKND